METGFILLCDRCEALNGKLYTLGGGWNTLRFPQIPFTFSFSIGFGMDVPWDATNQRHNLEVRVESPDGDALGEPFGVEFEAGRPPGSIAGQDQRLVIAFNTQQTFESTGPHAAIISVDGEEAGRSRFHVQHVSTPAQAT